MLYYNDKVMLKDRYNEVKLHFEGIEIVVVLAYIIFFLSVRIEG